MHRGFFCFGKRGIPPLEVSAPKVHHAKIAEGLNLVTSLPPLRMGSVPWDPGKLLQHSSNPGNQSLCH